MNRLSKSSESDSWQIIDVCTRAILGYTLCLRREYGRYDVIRTFETALTPGAPIRTTIPGLGPVQSGGFVSTVLPETAYACWRQIRFDNARAHLAADSLNVACEHLGCTVDVGPVSTAMEGLVDLVERCLRVLISFALVYARPRMDKTHAVDYVCLHLGRVRLVDCVSGLPRRKAISSCSSAMKPSTSSVTSMNGCGMYTISWPITVSSLPASRCAASASLTS